MEQRYFIVILLIVVVAGGGFMIWDKYFSNDDVDAYLKFEKQYVATMTADTYGGASPQATLDMFIAALKAGDVDLAAKYFMLDDNLSRDKWIKSLAQMKTNGLLDDMAKDLEKAKPDTDRTDENDFKFLIYNKDGNVGGWVNMQFNTHSKVWKIENL